MKLGGENKHRSTDAEIFPRAKNSLYFGFSFRMNKKIQILESKLNQNVSWQMLLKAKKVFGGLKDKMNQIYTEIDSWSNTTTKIEFLKHYNHLAGLIDGYQIDTSKLSDIDLANSNLVYSMLVKYIAVFQADIKNRCLTVNNPRSYKYWLDEALHENNKLVSLDTHSAINPQMFPIY